MVLPERSSKRKNGFVDVISCFDPTRLGGANSKSFFFYVNTCLKNHFVEHLHKKRKDAIRDVLRNTPNLSFEQVPPVESEEQERICDRGRSNQDIYASVRVGEFRTFVEQNEPELLPVVEIIFSSDTIKDTASKLGLTVYQFRSTRSRLRVLYECFEKGLAIPKRRSPYKKAKGRAVTGLLGSTRSPRRIGRIDYAFGSSGSVVASGAGSFLEKKSSLIE
jgi:hypothetical protein